VAAKVLGTMPLTAPTPRMATNIRRWRLAVIDLERAAPGTLAGIFVLDVGRGGRWMGTHKHHGRAVKRKDVYGPGRAPMGLDQAVVRGDRIVRRLLAKLAIVPCWLRRYPHWRPIIERRY
jgi:hypothetical protein